MDAVLAGMIAVGTMILGAGYLIGKLLEGRSKSKSDAITLANSEITTYREAVDHMRDEMGNLERKVDDLTTAVHKLTEERNTYRSMVMLEVIPPALQSALAATAAQAVIEAISQVRGIIVGEADRVIAAMPKFVAIHAAAEGGHA